MNLKDKNTMEGLYGLSGIISNSFSQWKFKNLITAYAKLYDAGHYELPFTAEPLTVIKLKTKIGRFRQGTKFLWVCGDRSFIDKHGIFEYGLSKSIQELAIIPVETFIADDEKYLKGIDFTTAKSTENEYMKRWDIQEYVSDNLKQQHINKDIER